MTTNQPKYVVVNENTLGYIYAEQEEYIGVLRASVLRGAPFRGKDDLISSFGQNIRPATKEDFNLYRVKVPPNF